MTSEDLERLWGDPSHWNRDGSYKCATDPRLIVPKRYGGGWTLNMEHPRAVIATIGLVLVVLGVAVGALFYARAN
jgi:uncharacterized membrane protein